MTMREEIAALRCLYDCGAVVGGGTRFDRLADDGYVERFTGRSGRKAFRLTDLGRSACHELRRSNWQ